MRGVVVTVYLVVAHALPLALQPFAVQKKEENGEGGTLSLKCRSCLRLRYPNEPVSFLLHILCVGEEVV